MFYLWLWSGARNCNTSNHKRWINGWGVHCTSSCFALQMNRKLLCRTFMVTERFSRWPCKQGPFSSEKHYFYLSLYSLSSSRFSEGWATTNAPIVQHMVQCGTILNGMGLVLTQLLNAFTGWQLTYCTVFDIHSQCCSTISLHVSQCTFAHYDKRITKFVWLGTRFSSRPQRMV